MTRASFAIAAALAATVLAGCAAQQPMIPPPLELPKKVIDNASGQRGAAVQESALRVGETPKPPAAEKTQTGKPASPAPQPPAAAEEAADITLAFEQIPLPSFIQAVYGTILKKNVNIDPAVLERKDLVTLRTGGPQTASQVESAVRLLLKSYGIAALDIGGLIRIVPDTAKLGYLPEIRRGRALPETPLPLRPIFQMVELEAVRNTDVAAWIRTMFANKVNLQEDPGRNAVLLSGNSDDVMAALEAIHVLDQPLMKGRQSARINPLFWSAEELAKKLSEVLQAEGYAAGTVVQTNFPVTLLPIQAINSIIVFTANPATMAHVTDWAKELDKPGGGRGAGSSYFTYQARYVDAESLAKTMQELLTSAAAPVAGSPTQAAPAKRPSRVVVNAASNRLIFQGNTEDYAQLLNLLEELDKPARAALIEVTVAEVTLTDRTKLGVEWAFETSGARGSTISGGTLGGLGIGTTGLTIRRLNSAGDLRLLLNALATSDQTKILSSPRVLARNGETATIQVGDEVPVLTTQQTTPTTGGTGSILQSIQYRNTGVVLKVRPVIHAGDRVDLDVSQEVSNPVSTTTGVSNSPTISTRKVETKLSVKDGATVLLGGLMKNNVTRGESGVPLLKEIPLVGQLFRTNSDEDVKTELLVLITPYVIDDDHDAKAVTEAFRSRLGQWARDIKATKPAAAEGGNQAESAAPPASKP